MGGRIHAVSDLVDARGAKVQVVFCPVGPVTIKMAASETTEAPVRGQTLRRMVLRDKRPEAARDFVAAHRF